MIIGAGITGLTAAIILAENGVSVTLIEKSSRVAPLLRGFSRGGFHFDTGFHHAKGLKRGAPLRCWLESLGLRLNFQACREVREIVCIHRGSYFLPCGEDLVEKNFPSSIAAYRDFCETSAKMQKFSPYMTGDPSAQFSLFPAASTSLAEYMSKLALDADLEKMLLARCMLFGVSPQDATLEDFSLVAGDIREKSMTLPGGGLAIAEAFERRLAELDITLICGQAVLSLNADGRFLKSITLESGEEIVTDHAIYTGHPCRLKKMIPKSALRPAWFTHIETMPETAEPLALYGSCGNALPEFHSWYCIPENGRLNCLEDDDPALCVMTGPARSDGRKACIALALTSGRADGGKLRRILEAKFPSLKREDGLRIIGGFSGNTMRQYIYGSPGSIYGNAHLHTSLSLLPVTRLNGFFLAGQSILLPGLLGCIVSAAVATSLMIGVENTLKKFRQCVKES